MKQRGIGGRPWRQQQQLHPTAMTRIAWLPPPPPQPCSRLKAKLNSSEEGKVGGGGFREGARQRRQSCTAPRCSLSRSHAIRGASFAGMMSQSHCDKQPCAAEDDTCQEPSGAGHFVSPTPSPPRWTFQRSHVLSIDGSHATSAYLAGVPHRMMPTEELWPL